MMILHHGSNVEVREPKILNPNRGLDFGHGFYTTTNLDQAIAFARRVTRNRGTGTATVSTYELDENAAFPICRVVKFDGVCDAWLDFVCDNRDGMGEIGREEAFKRLKVKTLYNQLVFATPLALSFIRFRESEVCRD